MGAILNRVLDFLFSSLSNSLTNNASTRRVVFFGFASLGALAMVFGLGWATALLIGFDQAQRFIYFKEILSFLEWMFTAGTTAAGLVYGVTKVAEAKAGGANDA